MASPPPKAVTMPATNVSIDNAVLNGIINPNGLESNAWFEWGTDNAAMTGRSPDLPAGAGTTDNQVNYRATGLQPRTTYFFRVAAINSGGKEAQGEIRSFSTLSLPTVTTKDPTAVTTSSAILNGEANPNGFQTRAWFEWGTDSNLIVYNITDNQVIGDGVSALPLSATIPVSAGGTYYYRSAASNPEGASRGDVVSFRANQLPDTTTAGATSITLNSAALNGTVNPNGFETFAWFEYGTDPSLSNPSITDNQLIGSGFSALPFQKNISELTPPYTTWYFRAVASNAGGTQRGPVKSFPTGEYFVAVGDSITLGTGDSIPADGVGFEPILQDNLSASRGYSITIANAGVGGVDSAYGAANISATLSSFPQAKYYLVLYGTNDADSLRPPVPRDEYKNNMRSIILAIKAAGKTPYLAKVPYTTNPRFSNTSIQDYNEAIDELVAENGITVNPPDFYTLFQNTSLLDADGLNPGVHPNGTGYQSMADLWFSALP